MKAADIPDKFQVPFAVDAGPGFIRPIPLDPTGEVGAAALTTGFPPPCFVDGGYPFGSDFNGLLNLITAWSQWQGAGAQVPYDATFQAEIAGYPKGVIVESLVAPGWFYLSTADDNVTDPDAAGAGWRLFCPVPLYAVDTGTANALSITLTPAPPTFAALTGFQLVVRKSSSPNTTASTITINSVAGPSTVSILHGDNTSIQAGELTGNEPFTIVPDGSNCILQSVANVANALLANSVTNAKLATMADQTVKGNISGGTATPADVPLSSIGVVSAGFIGTYSRSVPPAGWLACDGSTVSRTTYAALNAIAAGGGYAAPYGPGNGTTTFQIPDLRDLFIRGYFSATRAFASTQLDAMQDHAHPAGAATLGTTDTDVYGPTSQGIPGSATAVFQRQNAAVASQPKTGPVLTGAGYRTDTETRPINIALLLCIKF